ncbi:hypothetical protein FJT64_007362 [Amphibalanus amphitrite]|uniref:Uncharacterized protein n=1 Tax=Amphibalanus amphitrite TaxID=1232801 RepID=A0A6A4VUC8_AMPAM|nr:hypothetical protein FJT64_007362 [Amphibalanus amphitrite]
MFANSMVAGLHYDPFSEEQQERQQPSCIPLSSALRFYTNLPSRKPAAAAAKTAPAAGAGSHGPNHGQQTGGGGTAATAGLPTLGRASSTGSASPSGQWRRRRPPANVCVCVCVLCSCWKKVG